MHSLIVRLLSKTLKELSPAKFQIFGKDGNKTIVINAMTEDTTVFFVKVLLYCKKFTVDVIDADHLDEFLKTSWLMANGRQLIDEETLKSSLIFKESTVNLHYRLPGGGKEPGKSPGKKAKVCPSVPSPTFAGPREGCPINTN